MVRLKNDFKTYYLKNKTANNMNKNDYVLIRIGHDEYDYSN